MKMNSPATCQFALYGRCILFISLHDFLIFHLWGFSNNNFPPIAVILFVLAGILLFITALFGIQILIMSFKIFLKRKFLEGSAGFSLVVSILLFKIGFVSKSFGIFFNYSAFCLAILFSQVNLFLLEYIFLFSENSEKRFIFSDRSAFLGKRGLYLNFLLFFLFSFFFTKVIWNLYLLASDGG